MLGADTYTLPTLSQTVQSGLSNYTPGTTSSTATTGTSSGLQWFQSISDTALRAIGLLRTAPSSYSGVPVAPSFMDQYGSVVLVGGAALALVMVVAASRKKKRK